MNEVLLLARILLSYARGGLLSPLLSTSVERVAAWIAACGEWLLR